MYLHTKFVWESTWLGMRLVRGVVAVGVFERGAPEPSRGTLTKKDAELNYPKVRRVRRLILTTGQRQGFPHLKFCVTPTTHLQLHQFMLKTLRPLHYNKRLIQLDIIMLTLLNLVGNSLYNNNLKFTRGDTRGVRFSGVPILYLRDGYK
jgi:hypothetical protein